jgi:hypothetical protein
MPSNRGHGYSEDCLFNAYIAYLMQSTMASVVLIVVRSSSVEEDCRSDWAYPGGQTTRLRDRKGVF